MTTIQINNINKQYPTFSLKNVSFDIPQGYITGFIGPNGSGKTTTIKAILSLTQLDSGTIKVFNENAIDMNDIGVLLDNSHFVKDWTMLDIERVHSLFYKNWDSTLFFSYLQQFKINSTLKVEELSKGMTVKLLLACALSHKPKILILDEPTSGLDPVARDEVSSILQDFVSDEKNTVLFSTHITSDLENIADYIVFILNGEIVYKGEKEELLDDFLVIKGGSEELKQLDTDQLIGIKHYQTGFEALIKKSNVDTNSKQFILEKTTLDQIILFFNRGANHEEY